MTLRRFEKSDGEKRLFALLLALGLLLVLGGPSCRTDDEDETPVAKEGVAVQAPGPASPGPLRVKEPRGRHLSSPDEKGPTTVQVYDYRIFLASREPLRALQSITNQLTHWRVAFPPPPQNLFGEDWRVDLPHEHVTAFEELLRRKGNTHVKRIERFVSAPAPEATTFIIRFLPTGRTEKP